MATHRRIRMLHRCSAGAYQLPICSRTKYAIRSSVIVTMMGSKTAKAVMPPVPISPRDTRGVPARARPHADKGGVRDATAEENG